MLIQVNRSSSAKRLRSRVHPPPPGSRCSPGISDARFSVSALPRLERPKSRDTSAHRRAPLSLRAADRSLRRFDAQPTGRRPCAQLRWHDASRGINSSGLTKHDLQRATMSAATRHSDLFLLRETVSPPPGQPDSTGMAGSVENFRARGGERSFKEMRPVSFEPFLAELNTRLARHSR